jgi:Tol biopolymer transport system component
MRRVRTRPSILILGTISPLPERSSQMEQHHREASMMRRQATLLILVAVTMMTFGGGDVSATSLSGKIAWSNGKINVFDLTTGKNTQFAVSGVNPKFSPDGTRIAFQGGGGISVMNADGTNARLILNFGGIPAWSPDGAKITFHSNGIWVMNADGTALRQLTSHGMWSAFSPDGTQIVFSSNLVSPDYDLWIMNSDGSNPHLLLTRAGDDIDVVWSPSTQIHFGGNVDQQSSYEIFAFDPSTSVLTRLTYSAKQDFEPAASPDGSMIAWSSFRKTAGIYVMNADGSSPRLVIAGGRQPSWAP